MEARAGAEVRLRLEDVHDGLVGVDHRDLLRGHALQGLRSVALQVLLPDGVPPVGPVEGQGREPDDLRPRGTQPRDEALQLGAVLLQGRDRDAARGSAHGADGLRARIASHEVREPDVQRDHVPRLLSEDLLQALQERSRVQVPLGGDDDLGLLLQGLRRVPEVAPEGRVPQQQDPRRHGVLGERVSQRRSVLGTSGAQQEEQPDRQAERRPQRRPGGEGPLPADSHPASTHTGLQSSVMGPVLSANRSAGTSTALSIDTNRLASGTFRSPTKRWRLPCWKPSAPPPATWIG